MPAQRTAPPPPPLGEPPEPPIPHLRVEGLLKRAKGLRGRPGALHPGAFLPSARHNPASAVSRAPITQRKAAEAQARQIAEQSRPAQLGPAAQAAKGAGEAIVERAQDTAKLKREARQAKKATPQPVPQRSEDTVPMTTPVSPKDRKRGHVTDPYGIPRGHLKQQPFGGIGSKNAPHTPKPEKGRVQQFYGEDVTKPGKRTRKPSPLKPTVQEQLDRMKAGMGQAAPPATPEPRAAPTTVKLPEQAAPPQGTLYQGPPAVQPIQPPPPGPAPLDDSEEKIARALRSMRRRDRRELNDWLQESAEAQAQRNTDLRSTQRELTNAEASFLAVYMKRQRMRPPARPADQGETRE